MKCLFLSLCLLLIYCFDISAQNQPPQTLWAARDNSPNPPAPGYQTMSRSGSEFAYGMVLDANDNAYSISTYTRNDPAFPCTFPTVCDIPYSGIVVYKFTNSQGSKDPTWNSGKGMPIWSTNANIYSYSYEGPDKGIAVTNDGSVYILIRVENQTTDPIELKYEYAGVENTIQAFSDAKAVIIKLNSSGQYQQHRSLRHTGGTNFTASSIEADNEGDVFISGQFNGFLSFARDNGGTAPNNFDYVILGCTNDQDDRDKASRYIFRLAGGNIWPSKGWQIVNNNADPNNLDYYSPVLLSADGDDLYVFYRQSTTSSNNVEVRVKESQTTTDPTSITINCTSGTKYYDGNIDNANSVYLLKMNLNGTTINPVRVFESSNSYYPIDIKAKNGACYLTFLANTGVVYSHDVSGTSTKKSFVFNSVPSTVNRSSAIVIAKLNEDVVPSTDCGGDCFNDTEHGLGVSWIQTIFSDPNSSLLFYNQPFGGALSISGDAVYLSSTVYSSFSGANNFFSIDFPSITLLPSGALPSSITAISQKTTGSVTQYQQDIGVFKINTGNNNYLDGSLVWGAKIGSAGYDYPKSIAIDSRGSLFLGGYFNGQTDLDPTSVTYQLISSQGYDAFVAKYGCWGATIDGESNGCVGEFSTLTAVPDCPACSYSYEWNDVTNFNIRVD